jgi:murE/murF fusion protein
LFNTGIFTNLSQDHLDYHKNTKNYLKAKLYLFEKLIKKRGNVITDEQIPEFKKIKDIATNKNLNLISLFDKKNDFQFLSHQYEGESQLLEIKYKNSINKIKLNLIGKIQFKNVLMAVIASIKSSINIKDIINVIPKIKSVEGRFEKVGKIKNNSKVILDYAHTPDALKTCLINIKEQFPGKKIILVFGCGGNRDQNKRAKMGKIADLFTDKIYLTDDNPRLEQPCKIRKDIKKGIKKQKVLEFSNRAKAIGEAIKYLNTGEILLVAGKGHEKVQEIGLKKVFFSDKKIILDAIKIKNLKLSNNLKVNILNELSTEKKISNQISFGKARINSKEIKKNDIFFAIKGKINDGNKFISEAFKKKASIAVVNKIEKKINISRQIKRKDTLKFLAKSSELYRENIKTKIIAITGSCGKTTLKELLGNSLKQISKVGISPKSYNNKYGVPLSLFNLDQKNNYGVLEIGMDKKGEIDYLSRIVKPDVSVITNINYAHAKNFKNIKQIALAKSEIINNTKINGVVVLNADDDFYTLHKRIAKKRKLRILSFSINNQNANIKLVSIKKITNKFKATIRVNNLNTYFFISNNFQNNILNILAALAVMSIFIDIFKLKKNIFMGFKTPEGRGDITKIEINNKRLNLVDESYNSNPLSLKSAILNFDKIKTNNEKKYLLLGDMLELGKHSKKLHQTMGKVINNTKIDKVFVKGNKVLFTYNSVSKKKRGRVLNNNSQIIDLIKNDLNNNDYLMVKASNATGFNKIISEIKG